MHARRTRSYEGWISRLVPALVLGINPEGLGEEAKDGEQEEGDEAATRRFLCRCAAASHAVPALAEALLPLALLSLLRTAPPKSSRHRGGGGGAEDEEDEEDDDGGDDDLFLPSGFASRGKRRCPPQEHGGRRGNTGHDAPKSKEEVAARLARCLKHCLSRASPRPLQAVLGALTFLRRQSLHEMPAGGIAPSSPGGGGGPGTQPRRRSAASSTAAGEGAEPLAPAKAREAVGGLMGLDLDKRLLARAALRCGALTTAALYLELHLEDERQRRGARHQHRGGGGGQQPAEGKGGPGEEKALLLDEVDEAPALLLRIATVLAEPDAAAGVQAGTGLDGRIRAAAARETPDWGEALAAQDSLALRAQAVATAAHAVGPNASASAAAAGVLSQLGSAPSASAGAGVGGSAGAGAATVLRKLDLGHVLGAYLQGLQTRADERHAAALRELEYENAWRACRWQSLHAVASSSSPSSSAAAAAAAAAAGGSGGGGLLFRGPDPLMARHGPAGGDDDEEEEEEGWGEMGGTSDGVADFEGEESGAAIGTAASSSPPPLLRFHERLHAALRALAARDGTALAVHVASARRGLLTGLARAVPSPSEPARALGPLLARLQCLREVEEAASLALRPHLAAGPGSGSTAVACSSAVPPELSLAVRRGEASALLAGWHGRSRPAVAGGGGGDFEAMVEPVLALREVLVRALCPPLDARDALVRHAQGLAAAAR